MSNPSNALSVSTPLAARVTWKPIWIVTALRKHTFVICVGKSSNQKALWRAINSFILLMVSVCLWSASLFQDDKYWLYYRALLTSIFQLNKVLLTEFVYPYETLWNNLNLCKISVCERKPAVSAVLETFCVCFISLYILTDNCWSQYKFESTNSYIVKFLTTFFCKSIVRSWQIR